MLPANGPASGSEHARQPIGDVRPDPQLGDADGQSGRVLDADVLDVDSGLFGHPEEPGQLTWPVWDDHLHCGEVARRTAVLAGDPVHAVAAPLQQVSDMLDGPIVAGRKV